MRGTKRGFRRTIASLLVFSLCIAAVPALPARADNKINELQNQIKEEQKKQNDTKDQKKQTENNINSLNNVKTSLQGELNGLTDDLTQISSRLEEIEQNIIDKNQEISDTQEKLEQALEEIARFDICRRHGIIVAESAADKVLPPLSAPYAVHREYRYGKIKLTVYHRNED